MPSILPDLARARNDSSDDPPDLLAVAEQLRARHIFPVPLRGDKRPLLLGWRTSPWGQRRAVFACGAAKGIGVACGMRRGDTGLSLVPLDFDAMEHYEAWRESSAEARRLADAAPTVATSRGRHVYLQVRGEVRSWYTSDGPIQCEGKASGNFVVVPPTVHPSGPPYEWIVPLDGREIPVVEETSILPGWGPPKHSERNNNGLSEKSPCPEKRRRETRDENTWQGNQRDNDTLIQEIPEWALAVIGDHVPTGPGQRNNTLFRMATALAKGGASPESLRSLAPAIVASWHRLALPAIRTKDPAVSLGDFRRGLDWIEAHWRGASPETPYELPEPAAVLSIAKTHPFDAGGRYGTRSHIASILRALDCLHGGRVFALDGRTLAAMAEVTRPAAAEHVAKIVNAGLAVVIDRGQGGTDSSKRRSARYRWTGPSIGESAG